MRVREIDLRHGADSARFGNAMLACEGYAPECSHAGRCLSNGDCFASPAHLVAARMIETLLPTDGRPGMHFAYLQRCAEMLREGRLGL